MAQVSNWPFVFQLYKIHWDFINPSVLEAGIFINPFVRGHCDFITPAYRQC